MCIVFIIFSYNLFIKILFIIYTDDRVLPFLQFNNRKVKLRRRLDGVSNTIYIPNGFPFGLQTHTRAYVSYFMHMHAI